MKIISLFFSKLGSFLILLSRKIHLSPQSREKNAFKKNIVDTVNTNYDLNESSLVFDIGGYQGQWASDIYSRYNCHVYIFEPVPEFAENIKSRFLNNKKMMVHNFGLSGKTQTSLIHLNDDASSTIQTKSDKKSEIQLMDIIDFVKENNIKKVNLMKINIEGGEYELLERLLKTDYIKNIDNLLVQFHNYFPKAKERMGEIQNKLKKTHKPEYQFEFIWELWKLK